MTKWKKICLLFVFILVVGLPFVRLTSQEEQSFLKLASWNIRIFSNSRTDEDIRNICRVAQKFDFITIIELRDELVLKRLVNMLKNEFGRSYSYELSPPVGAGVKELYAFLYDNKFIQVVHPGQIFEDNNFLRKPYYGTFRAKNFDFTIVCTHIIWGNSVTERRKEINRMAHVYRTIQDSDPIENDVILVGDFNRDPDDDLAWGPLHAISSMLRLFDLPEKSMIWDSHLYDNILFQANYTREYTLDKGIVRFDETDFGNDDNAASKSVSDHRPVWALFRIDGSDDD